MKTVLENLLKSNLLPWEVKQTGPQDFTLVYYAYQVRICGGNEEELADSLEREIPKVKSCYKPVKESLQELLDDLHMGIADENGGY